MSKNNKTKTQVKPEEEVKVEATNKNEVLTESDKPKEETNVNTQDTEKSKAKEKIIKDINKFIEEIKEFVKGYEKYHNILNINPLKETLSTLQKNKNLDKEDKKYLAQINNTIYAKTLKQGETMPENYQGLVLSNLDEKVNRLYIIANGYGKNHITTITDSREDSFYCIKEIEQEGNKFVQDSFKITNVEGKYVIETMNEQESKNIIETYQKLSEDEELKKDINVFTKEIDKDPIYAANYYATISERRKIEAQDKNKRIEQVEEEAAEI